MLPITGRLLCAFLFSTQTNLAEPTPHPAAPMQLKKLKDSAAATRHGAGFLLEFNLGLWDRRAWFSTSSEEATDSLASHQGIDLNSTGKGLTTVNN